MFLSINAMVNSLQALDSFSSHRGKNVIRLSSDELIEGDLNLLKKYFSQMDIRKKCLINFSHPQKKSRTNLLDQLTGRNIPPQLSSCLYLVRVLVRFKRSSFLLLFDLVLWFWFVWFCCSLIWWWLLLKYNNHRQQDFTKVHPLAKKRLSNKDVDIMYIDIAKKEDFRHFGVNRIVWCKWQAFKIRTASPLQGVCSE